MLLPFSFPAAGGLDEVLCTYEHGVWCFWQLIVDWPVLDILCPRRCHFWYWIIYSGASPRHCHMASHMVVVCRRLRFYHLKFLSITASVDFVILCLDLMSLNFHYC